MIEDEIFKVVQTLLNALWLWLILWLSKFLSDIMQFCYSSSLEC